MNKTVDEQNRIVRLSFKNEYYERLLSIVQQVNDTATPGSQGI